MSKPRIRAVVDTNIADYLVTGDPDLSEDHRVVDALRKFKIKVVGIGRFLRAVRSD